MALSDALLIPKRVTKGDMVIPVDYAHPGDVTNGEFDNWTGDNPDNFILVGEPANGEVSEVGSGEGNGGSGSGSANLYSVAAGGFQIVASTSIPSGTPCILELYISYHGGTKALYVNTSDGEIVENVAAGTTGVVQFAWTPGSDNPFITLGMGTGSSPLNVTIDYVRLVALVTVGDPPEGTVFQNQDDVDNFLALKGWDAFKHLIAAYDALPPEIAHTVTFELATGVHRPRSGDSSAWSMTSKTILTSGLISIDGSDSSDWTPIDPSLVDIDLTAFQVGSKDPYIQVAGTPFNGFDLRGYYAVFSTGQTVLIHDHDDDTLHVLANLDPTPIIAPSSPITSVTIARPSTELRNSLDDVNAYSATYIVCDSRNPAFTFTGNQFKLNRLSLDAMGSYGGAQCIGGGLVCSYVLVDQGNSLKNDNGDGFYTYGTLSRLNRSSVYNCSVITSAASNTADLRFYARSIYLAQIEYCYFRGGQDGCTFEDVVLGIFKSSVLDSCAHHGDYGDTAASIRAISGTRIDFWAPSGYENEIRGTKGTAAGIFIEESAAWRSGYGASISFIDNVGPCLRIRDRASPDTSPNSYLSGTTPGLRNGGGNLDVGVEFVGSYSKAYLNPNDTVTGAAGDVRMSDGTIKTWAEVEAGGVGDSTFNSIKKDT